MQQVIVLGALPISLVNFRGELIRVLRANECEVIAMSAPAESAVITQLVSMGASFKSFPVQRNGFNPATDLKTLVSLRKIFQGLKPDVVLAYTIKPIIWGGLACRVEPKARFYALITGLGFAFQEGTSIRKLLTNMVSLLYRVSLRRATRVIFQNPDNMREFISRGIVPACKCVVVNGSGVDMQRLAHTPLPDGNTIFLTIGRLLGEKGFREYSQAAKIVKAKHPNVIFQLLGPEDPSPDGIPISEVEAWVRQGLVEYLGSTADVRPYIKDCHIYVLPSYHEGMPRTVLEAMAIGRPILTTDVPGCRETVIRRENGFLVPKGNAQALAEQMVWFIENKQLWEKMGRRSREIAEEKFDVHKVNARLIEIMAL